MASKPTSPAAAQEDFPSLELTGVTVRFPGASRPALQDVSLTMERARRWAIVGESGSGKTTLMRALLGLLPLEAGTVRWFGRALDGLGRAELRRLRARVQPVFQDPIASFDPRFDNRRILEEPLIVHGWTDATARLGRCREVLAQVGLDPATLDAHPRGMSGGQRQRLAIARAMTLSPDVLVADEPTAALDLSVQGQILSLLLELHERAGLTLVFISHDLPLVSQLCDRAAVLYAGRVVEAGPADEVLLRPRHPYTRDLLEASAGPLPATSAGPLPATSAGPLPATGTASWPGPGAEGCPYAPRCRHREPACTDKIPLLRDAGPVRLACRLDLEA